MDEALPLADTEERWEAVRRDEARLRPGVVAFLDSVPLPSSPPVLLHTEVMREHLLVSGDPSGGWSLSGLYDFEPAMTGCWEYEFASVEIFVAGRRCPPHPNGASTRWPNGGGRWANNRR